MTVRRLLAEQPCERLDVFLSARLGVTRSAAKKLLDGGHITVGGKAVKASRPVNAGEEVVAEIPDPETLDLTPQECLFDVVSV